jgi:putative ATPase
VLSGEGSREAIQEARKEERYGSAPCFIDEIHRNKAQQDALLHAVEHGTVTLIGATTENPSFEVNGALLSRCRVVVLNQLSESEIKTILNNALIDEERGLASYHPSVSDQLLERIAHSAEGDARVALTALDAAVAID